MLEQDRINAMISYFFLGPLFLLAKKNTPLADPYVRGHAIQASIIIGISFLIFIIYFILRPYIQFSLLGFDLRSIILALIMIVCCGFLLRGAYRAYQGTESHDTPLTLSENMSNMTSISGIYTVESEEDRIRILASMLPYFGIYLSLKYENPLMRQARIIASFFTILIIFSLIFTGSVSFISFIITTVYIILFVVMGVYLFLYGRFISWNILTYIPSYREVEGHIVASFHTLIEFIRVVFGKEKHGNYRSYFDESSKKHELIAPTQKYFMPAALIGLPVWNIFCLPSLFLAPYKEYRGLIIQGLIITLIFIGLFFIEGGMREGGLLLLLFPIVHIMSYAPKDISTHTPIIGIMIRAGKGYKNIESKVSNMKSTSESSGYSYTIPQESPKPETLRKESISKL